MMKRLTIAVWGIVLAGAVSLFAQSTYNWSERQLPRQAYYVDLSGDAPSTNAVKLMGLLPGAMVVDSSTKATWILRYSDPLNPVWSLVTSNAVEGTYGATATATTNLATYNSGTVADATTMVAVETGDALMRKTVLTITGAPILMTSPGDVLAQDEATTNAAGGVKLYDFPQGRILVHGVLADVRVYSNWVAKIPNASTGRVAIGSAQGIPITNMAWTSTYADLLPSTSAGPVTSRVATALAAAAQLDGTTTAKDMYLNVMAFRTNVAAGAHTSTGLVNGTVTFTWSYLGDY